MEEPPKVRHLDFSEFHDLMHRPFTAECRSMYGGSRRHLSLWWEFIGQPALARRFLCPTSRHRWCDGWSKALGDIWVCANCGESREK